MIESQLHATARAVAETLEAPDRKQLRFNEIVSVAMRFYPGNMEAGVRELVEACDRAKLDLYDKKRPMWMALRDDYGWMAAGGKEDAE